MEIQKAIAEFKKTKNSDYFYQEYNGDLFHANPKKFEKHDTPIPYSNITSDEIWEKDKYKIETLLSERNIKTIVIWESELPTYEELINIVNYERKL